VEKIRYIKLFISYYIYNKLRLFYRLHNTSVPDTYKRMSVTNQTNASYLLNSRSRSAA